MVHMDITVSLLLTHTTVMAAAKSVSKRDFLVPASGLPNTIMGVDMLPEAVEYE